MSNMFKPKIPDAPTPAPPAPEPILKPKKLEIVGSSERKRATSQRRGLAALRIDPARNGMGGGTGLNIPN